MSGQPLHLSSLTPAYILSLYVATGSICAAILLGLITALLFQGREKY